LYFKYGPLATNPIAKSTSYKALNLTYDIQTLELTNNNTDQLYKPKTYFFYQDGYNGALRTDPSETPF